MQYKKDYAIMRNTSDKLYEEYGLSILKHEQQNDRYNKFATSSLYKESMKDSFDYAIANAKDYNEFIKILQDLDYIVIDKNNTLSIRREPYKRNTRIERQFGNQYSRDNIYKRILEEQPLFKHFPQAYLTVNNRLNYYSGEKNKLFQNKSDLSHLFFKYEKSCSLWN